MEFLKVEWQCWMLLLNNMFDLWLIRYTTFFELLPLIALGTLPLVKVVKITQEIDSNTLTLVNFITLSSPFTTFSFSASAAFEVWTPSRIQVRLFAQFSKLNLQAFSIFFSFPPYLFFVFFFKTISSVFFHVWQLFHRYEQSHMSYLLFLPFFEMKRNQRCFLYNVLKLSK